MTDWSTIAEKTAVDVFVKNLDGQYVWVSGRFRGLTPKGLVRVYFYDPRSGKPRTLAFPRPFVRATSTLEPVT